MEEQDVEHYQDLFLPRGELLQLQGRPVVHRYREPARIRYGNGLVDEDLVDYVLEDDDGFSQLIVLAGVLRYRAGQLLVLPPVPGDVVAGRRELRTRRHVRLESRILHEIQLGLQVLAPELQIPVTHPGNRICGDSLKGPVLLRVAYRLQKLLCEDVQGRRDVPIALLHGQPLRGEVYRRAQIGHGIRGYDGGHLALPHMDMEILAVVLHDEVAPVIERDVHPFEGRVLEIVQVSSEGGVQHPHDRRFAHPVCRMDECKRRTELDRIVEFVE